MHKQATVLQSLWEHSQAEMRERQRILDRIVFSAQLDSYFKQGLITREEAERMRDMRRWASSVS